MVKDASTNQVWLSRAEELRDEAWAALTAEPTFAAVKAFDAAVVAVGGTTILPTLPAKVSGSLVWPSAVTSVLKVAAMDRARRMSQGDAAAEVLRDLGEPTSGADILSLLPVKGVTVGGDKPVINFTSTLSKDDRFESMRFGGNYLWWFKGEGLPPGWNEPADRDLLAEPAGTSVHSNQETANADNNT